MSTNSYCHVQNPLKGLTQRIFDPEYSLSPSPMKPTWGLSKQRLFIAIVFFLLSGCSTTHMSKIETHALNEHANLSKAESDRLDLILVDQERAWKNYQKIYVEVNNVNFDERWLRDYRGRISNNYIARIQKNYSKLLKEALEKNLQEQGTFVIVQKPSDDAITLRSDINDLIIRRPDTIDRTKVFAHSAGIATIYSELVKNEKKLAIFQDREETRDRGFLKPARIYRTFNHIDFKNLIERWAERITENLS